LWVLATVPSVAMYDVLVETFAVHLTFL